MSMTQFIRLIPSGLAVGVLLLALFSVPQELRAQLPASRGGPPATVEGLVEQMRAGNTQWMSEFFRQVRGPRSPAELQALGDSIVAFLQEPQPSGSFVHVDILGNLRTAIASERGTPFVQGIDLFYRIYDTVEDPDIKAMVLTRLASVSPPGRLRPVLIEALEHDDIRALPAVRILAEEMGPAGVRMLQDAYCAERIASYPAHAYLRRYFAQGILDPECRESQE